MLLSIIIPTLNEEKYLPLLLDSLKSETFKDYEVIVSDGGSKDQTLAIARRAGCRTVIDDKVKHPSRQRNIGATLAQGEILLFLDADTVLNPDFLSLAVEEFHRRKLVGAGFYIKFNPNSFVYRIFALNLNSFCRLRQYLAPAAVGAALLANRRAHQKIKGFDESLSVAEDYDYCFRLSRVGKWRMIKSVKLAYSARRPEKEGKFKTLSKWLRMGIFTIFNLKIKKKIVNYEFGKY